MTFKMTILILYKILVAQITVVLTLFVFLSFVFFDDSILYCYFK